MKGSIFVAGATGTQGSPLVKLLLQRSYKVHILVRDPASSKAQNLKSLGAILHAGDLESIDAIENAIDDSQAIYFAIPYAPDATKYAKNIIEAAQRKKVTHVIYSSVARAGDHESFPGWNANYPLASYWTQKHEIEDMVRGANFGHWTILRPAFFMQNFCRPVCDHMFPDLLLRPRKLRVPYRPNTTLDLIGVEDIAKFALRAFESPEEFSGREVALASEKLTASEIAEKLEGVRGEEVGVEYISDEEERQRLAKGDLQSLVLTSYVWHREVGYNVDIGALQKYGITLTPIAEALDRQALDW
ncbi:NAD(P)-binding protein [Corynespora cassiicola Philippines]|uniref:NAD(P)-binding protein n=1 Tax=Corynespora cassiicola Philippines TaxID=1448308 RepID=A0A2T2NM66_CORCC|nr:NAD(P)-binding protein [Corynespora cassiicola Philippines]